MRYLLDTSTFLWMITNHPKLSAKAAQIILEPSNELLFSSVSAWEIAIKYCLGKLDLPQPPQLFIPGQVQQNGLAILPVQLDHGLYTALLPDLHNDPFDRLLIAQAVVEGLIFLTSDAQCQGYPVQIAW